MAPNCYVNMPVETGSRMELAEPVLRQGVSWQEVKPAALCFKSLILVSA